MIVKRRIIVLTAPNGTVTYLKNVRFKDADGVWDFVKTGKQGDWTDNRAEAQEFGPIAAEGLLAAVPRYWSKNHRVHLETK